MLPLAVKTKLILFSSVFECPLHVSVCCIPVPSPVLLKNPIRSVYLCLLSPNCRYCVSVRRIGCFSRTQECRAQLQGQTRRVLAICTLKVLTKVTQYQRWTVTKYIYLSAVFEYLYFITFLSRLSLLVT